MTEEISTPGELVPVMIETARELDELNKQLRDSGAQKARTEHDYRRAKSIAMLRIAGTEQAKNAEMREAAVHQFEVEGSENDPVTVGILRYKRDLAEAASSGLLEAVRSKRTELSALQTVANALKEEAAFVRTTTGDTW